MAKTAKGEPDARERIERALAFQQDPERQATHLHRFRCVERADQIEELLVHYLGRSRRDARRAANIYFARATGSDTADAAVRERKRWMRKQTGRTRDLVWSITDEEILRSLVLTHYRDLRPVLDHIARAVPDLPDDAISEFARDTGMPLREAREGLTGLGDKLRKKLPAVARKVIREEMSRTSPRESRNSDTRSLDARRAFCDQLRASLVAGLPLHEGKEFRSKAPHKKS